VSRKASPKSSPFVPIIALIGVAGIATLGWVVSRPTKVLTLDPAMLPTVAAQGILKGDSAAPVQVMEFADFECPGCGYFATVTEPDVMKRLVETGEIAFRFFDLPLVEIHPNSVAAHNAARCANEQGKFWEMHDRIFAGQNEWNAQATRNPKRVLQGYVGPLGMDVSAWEECYDSERMLPVIAANRAEAARLRIGQTPTFVIGNRVDTSKLGVYSNESAYCL
jgi:protein-disulfide isomerase